MGWYLGHLGLLQHPHPPSPTLFLGVLRIFQNFRCMLEEKKAKFQFLKSVCMCKGKTNTLFFLCNVNECFHHNLPQDLILIFAVFETPIYYCQLPCHPNSTSCEIHCGYSWTYQLSQGGQQQCTDSKGEGGLLSFVNTCGEIGLCTPCRVTPGWCVAATSHTAQG